MDYRKEAKAFSGWMNAAGKRELAAAIRYFCEEAPTEERSELSLFARELSETHYGKKVYFRGLIEFSSYCKNDCYYCGLRKSNQNATRYRLTETEILDCCRTARVGLSHLRTAERRRYVLYGRPAMWHHIWNQGAVSRLRRYSFRWGTKL